MGNSNEILNETSVRIYRAVITGPIYVVLSVLLFRLSFPLHLSLSLFFSRLSRSFSPLAGFFSFSFREFRCTHSCITLPATPRQGPGEQDSIQGHNIQKPKVRSRENLTSRRTGLTGFGVRLVKMVRRSVSRVNSFLVVFGNNNINASLCPSIAARDRIDLSYRFSNTDRS